MSQMSVIEGNLAADFGSMQMLLEIFLLILSLVVNLIQVLVFYPAAAMEDCSYFILAFVFWPEP